MMNFHLKGSNVKSVLNEFDSKCRGLDARMKEMAEKEFQSLKN
jgi:hypothetical protein